jgi:hypothetical protein
MASVVGDAGGSALRRAVVMAAAVVAATALLLVVTLSLTWWAVSRSPQPAVTLAIVLAVIVAEFWYFRSTLRDLFDTAVDASYWAKGAIGERAAADDFALLPDEYLVLNDVHPEFGFKAAWNWDHVVIGPNGIFVIDAKNYSSSRIGSAAADSRTKRNVKQVRGYAVEFKKALVGLNDDLKDEFIVPVLAYVHEGTWVDNPRERDVRVLPLRLVRNDILTRSRSSLRGLEATKIANLLFSMYEPYMAEAYRASFQRWCTLARDGEWRTPAVSELPRPVPANPQSSPIDLNCPLCGAPMRLHEGGYGAFYGCTNYRITGCRGKRDVTGRSK